MLVAQERIATRLSIHYFEAHLLLCLSSQKDSKANSLPLYAKQVSLTESLAIRNQIWLPIKKRKT